MRLGLCMLALVLVAAASGCCMPNASPVGGAIVMDTVGPVAVGDQTVKSTKVGRSMVEGIILVSSGDGSIEAAMRAAGIQKVHHVDTQTFSILGVYTRAETIVYGE